MFKQLTINLLGSTEIFLEGDPLDLSSAKSRAILFYLVLDRRQHPRESLAGLLWPSMPEATAKTNLRQSLSALKKLLPDHLEITRQHVGFRSGAVVSVDTVLLETEIENSGDDIDLLRQAIVRYKGNFLEGFFVENASQFESWATLWREHFHHLALRVFDLLAAHYTRHKNVSLGIQYTKRLLNMEPWREEYYQQLMRLLAWDGQFTSALVQYKNCQKLLAAEFGVAPLLETTQLFEHIKTLREKERYLALPSEPNRFVDRDELQNANALLRNPDCRLLSIIGPGGAGKTRLIIEMARQQNKLFLDGVFFVELAGVDGADEDALETAIATAMGLQFNGSRTSAEQIESFLREKEVLLILDNFEHLLVQSNDGMEKSASLLPLRILDSTKDSKILLSSRERTNFDEEWVFELRGLPYPQSANLPDLETFASIQLFQQVAQRIRSKFDLESEKSAVVEICKLVQGLPLGIKLAASLVNNQTVSEIADSLRTNVINLSTPIRNISDRHRSLQATFEYSWQLLSDVDQSNLSHLALFRGGFTFEAAAEVTQATKSGLARLVDKSLISFSHDGRYEFHALLREFAEEKYAHLRGLNQDDRSKNIKEKFSHYFLTWIGGLNAEIKGANAKKVLDQIHRDLNNIRQAWQWAIQSKHYREIMTALPTITHFYIRGASVQEGASLLAQAISQYPKAVMDIETSVETSVEVSHEDRAALCQLMTARAELLYQQGLIEESIESAKQALELIEGRDDLFAAMAYLQLGASYRHNGELEAAVTKLEHALELAIEQHWRYGEARINLELGRTYEFMGHPSKSKAVASRGLALARLIADRTLEGESLNVLGGALFSMGEILKASEICHEALIIMHEMGYLRSESSILAHLAKIEGWLGNFEASVQMAEKGIEIDRLLGDHKQLAIKLNNLGLQNMNLGDPITAKRYYEQSLEISRAFKDMRLEGILLGNLGDVAMSLGDFVQAQVYYDEALFIRRSIKDLGGEAWILCSMSLLAGKDARFEDALAFGRQALKIIDITKERSKEGYAWTHIGHAHVGLTQLDDAKLAYEKSLAIRQELNQKHIIVISLCGLADIHYASGDLDTAREWVEKAVIYLNVGELGGTRESGRTEWSCYQILQACHDPRAKTILEDGVTRIQTIAKRIHRKEQREQFLQSIPAHRNLINAFELSGVINL